MRRQTETDASGATLSSIRADDSPAPGGVPAKRNDQWYATVRVRVATTVARSVYKFSTSRSLLERETQARKKPSAFS